MKLNKKIYFFDKGIFNPYRMSNRLVRNLVHFIIDDGTN